MKTRAWFPIVGHVLAGKSVITETLLDFFLEKEDINTTGFIQPSRFEDGDRIGYDLTVVCNDKSLKTMEFARLNIRAQPGVIPYRFNNDVFEQVYEQASTFSVDERPVLIFLDEIGRLEVVGEGHGKSIRKYLEITQDASRVYLIVALNHRRNEMIDKFMTETGFVRSEMRITVPCTPDDITTLAESIYREITH